MQGFIGATLLTSKEAQPQSKPFEIYDNRLSGFMLRVQPSGVRSYYARFGRNRRVVLGKVGTVTPEEARERCQKVLGNVAHGCHRCTASAEQTASRSECSSPTRIRSGSTRVAHAPPPTHSRSYIGYLERGTPSLSQPLQSSESSRGRHGV
jgi:hypothetical protein